MNVPGLITLPYRFERPAPPFESNDIKSPESLPRYFIDAFTTQGQRVFDPFAGLGTTLFTAEKMGRVPFGLEYEGTRHAWVAGQLTHWQNHFHADAANMRALGLPKMDFCFTCPPFMKRGDRWNPLYAGDPDHAGYERYLKRMDFILKQLPPVLKRGAMLVIQADNLTGRPFTPLVRDLGTLAARHFRQMGESTILWRGAPETYRHTQCLIFKNSAP